MVMLGIDCRGKTRSKGPGRRLYCKYLHKMTMAYTIRWYVEVVRAGIARVERTFH